MVFAFNYKGKVENENVVKPYTNHIIYEMGEHLGSVLEVLTHAVSYVTWPTVKVCPYHPYLIYKSLFFCVQEKYLLIAHTGNNKGQ